MNSSAAAIGFKDGMLPSAAGGPVDPSVAMTLNERERAQMVAELVRTGANPLFALARTLSSHLATKG